MAGSFTSSGELGLGSVSPGWPFDGGGSEGGLGMSMDIIPIILVCIDSYKWRFWVVGRLEV